MMEPVVMSPMDQYELSPDLKICRILNGMWQVAGAHGSINPEAAVEEMVKYYDEGFTTWDLADIYGPAEDFIGDFMKRLPEQARKKVQALTKWVPEPQK